MTIQDRRKVKFFCIMVLIVFPFISRSLIPIPIVPIPIPISIVNNILLHLFNASFSLPNKDTTDFSNWFARTTMYGTVLIDAEDPGIVDRTDPEARRFQFSENGDYPHKSERNYFIKIQFRDTGVDKVLSPFGRRKRSYYSIAETILDEDTSEIKVVRKVEGLLRVIYNYDLHSLVLLFLDPDPNHPEDASKSRKIKSLKPGMAVYLSAAAVKNNQSLRADAMDNIENDRVLRVPGLVTAADSYFNGVKSIHLDQDIIPLKRQLWQKISPF